MFWTVRICNKKTLRIQQTCVAGSYLWAGIPLLFFLGASHSYHFIVSGLKMKEKLYDIIFHEF